MVLTRHIKAVFSPLHHHRSGQSLIMVTLVIFTLACFLIMVINVGHRLTLKIQMQNAADSAAYTEAIWNARALNMICVLNVGMTECIALTIMFKAYKRCVDDAEIALPINIVVATALVAVLTPFGLQGIPQGWLNSLNTTQSSILPTYKNIAKAMDKAVKDILPKVMRVCGVVETALEFMPILAYLQASAMAGHNQAGDVSEIVAEIISHTGDTPGSHPNPFSGVFYYVPLPIKFKLPVEKGKYGDYKHPTLEGGGSYQNYLCWSGGAMSMRLPFLNDLFHKVDEGLGWDVDTGFLSEIRILIDASLLLLSAIIPTPFLMYWLYYWLETNAAFTGQSQTDKKDITTTNCEKCTEKNGTATWEPPLGQPAGKRDIQQNEFDRAVCKNTDKCSSNLKVIKNNDPCEETTYESTGLIKGPCTGHVCKTTCDNSSQCYYSGPCYLYKRVLKKCLYQEDVTTSTDNNSNFTPPLMLSDNYTIRLKNTAIVMKSTDTGTPIYFEEGKQVEQSFTVQQITKATKAEDGKLSEFTEVLQGNVTFGEGGSSESVDSGKTITLPKTIIAIASAEISNPTPNGDDLFNQNWQARLVPGKLENLTITGIRVIDDFITRIFKILQYAVNPIWLH